MCVPQILATPCHSSLKPHTQLGVGKQLREQSAQVKRPVSSESIGDCMVDRKGEQDEWVRDVCVMGPLRTRLITELKGRGSPLRYETRTLIKSLPEATRRSL